MAVGAGLARGRQRKITPVPWGVMADPVAELGPVRQARGMLSCSTGRVGERSERVRSTSWSSSTGCRLHPCISRHGVTHDVLACWFQVDRSTITRTVGEIRPLLADRGCLVEGGLRLRTPADVIACPGATGRTALMDATGIRVRRPGAHRGGRSRFDAALGGIREIARVPWAQWQKGDGPEAG